MEKDSLEIMERRMPQHTELVKSNRFQVFIENHRFAFSKVSGLGGGISKEVYAEGGGVSNPHVMRMPKTQLKAVTLERGLQIGKQKLKNLKPGVFVPWVQIIVIGDNGKPQYEYFLEEVWVTKWEVSGLDALNGKVLIDTFELEYVNIKKESLG